MGHAVKILAFAGSSRVDSFNKKLIQIAAESAKKAGAQVTLIDLKDYPMPLVDQDLEASSGIPENAQKVKDMMTASDGFLIASPEYNSSITPLLKNTIDWASRSSVKGEPAMIAYKGKVAAIMSASPGGLGGMRSLVTVRSVLENNGVIVLPRQQAIPKAHEAFDASGKFMDAKQQDAIDKLVADLVRVIEKLKA